MEINKIDKSFLEDNCQDERGRGTLETVFFFAQRLNLRTIAEGVETIEQLKFLQSMDCDRVQGYLFCRPIKKEDFLVLTMTDNSPIVEEDNYLKKQGSFSTYKLLLDAIKTEYQLIIYGNLFKNSYYLMSQGDFFFNAATAGIIDDMTDVAISMCTPDCKEEYMKKLSRAALIDAFNRGERRVEMIVKQDVGDEIATFDTVVHLSVHPYKDDILMVGFSRRLS